MPDNGRRVELAVGEIHVHMGIGFRARGRGAGFRFSQGDIVMSVTADHFAWRSVVGFCARCRGMQILLVDRSPAGTVMVVVVFPA